MNENPSPTSSEGTNGPAPKEYSVHSVSTPNADVHFLFPPDFVKYHGNPTQPAQKSYASVLVQINENLDWLFSNVAREETEAARQVIELGNTIAAFLESGFRSRREFIQSVARKVTQWPVMIEAEPESAKNVAELKKQLKLGEGVNLRLDVTSLFRAG